jgi:hypothetical protein
MRVRIEQILAPLYRAIRTSRLIPQLWRPRIVTARFADGNGQVTKFIHRGRTVARWIPREEQWLCRKPYDLVLSPPMP